MEFAKDNKKGLLQRLDEGVVIGDGGFLIALEKRGYVKAGPWTPEACVENPEAVRQLHREFLRAGSDVMQAFTFYASESNLKYRGNEAGENFSEDEINSKACKLAREVSEEGDCLVAGGFAQHPNYQPGINKEKVQEDFRKQVDVFVENGVDFLICEYFENIEEIIWAIEVCKETKLSVVANMCIGPEGEVNHISCGECAVKMVKAGADVVGVNCRFDPFVSLEAVRLMKKALDAEGLKAHLICQPLAFFTPDAGKLGFLYLSEFPFALEPRTCSRWDIHCFAREAYDLGVRYIGGCCGFEPYHIRAIAEELAEERGKKPKASEKHEMWGGGLRMHTKPWVRARACRSHWEKINPSSGRPYSASFSKPDN
ncbi:betaine--homocysteine S-methyltransferase 1-like isoform X1 [Tachypleus tridentatus]|uniref:betaine--homocysteine S-methyltransferase 1-like isoform X1 n=1 Tax=Tachypleus tridentatus TaxID=6853 RepID=UPI003FCF2208